MQRLSWLTAFVLTLGLTLSPALADAAAAMRVGRISLADSGSELRPSGADWAAALINEPVADGTGLRTAAAAQAELRLSGLVIALAGGTEIEIVKLDGDTARIAVKSGRVGVSLDRRSARRNIEIDAAGSPVQVTAPGQYEIDSTSGLRTGGSTEDPFGAWWRARASDPAPIDHVAAAIPGAEALAGNGAWDTSAGDGPVWYPKDLPANWAPYRFGSWRNLPPWGWTWIDEAVWGFAPSHFGRWARIDGKWGWLPGTGNAATEYSPAAVAFLGTPGVGLSVAGAFGPAEAWFPLAPGKEAERNRPFASAVPRAVFTGGKPVAEALVDIPPWRLADAPLLPGPPTIATPRPSAPAPVPVPAAMPAIARAAPTPGRVIALDTPTHAVKERIKVKLAARRPHAAPPARAHLASAPLRLAVAPARPAPSRRHMADARRIVRQ